MRITRRGVELKRGDIENAFAEMRSLGVDVITSDQVLMWGRASGRPVTG